MFLADFHVHSTFSDGQMNIPDVVDLFGRLGFGAIAITDHLCESKTVLGRISAYADLTLTEANFPLYLNILRSEAERAWKQYKMVVIPGVELTKNSLSNHHSAHILGLGIEQFLSADGDIVELPKRIRELGGIAIAAHPVWTRVVEKQTYHLWNRRFELEQEFDAWEVASGSYLFPEVEKSRLPKIASSDLHVASQVSSWKTVLDCERHPQAILHAIRKQQVSFRRYDLPYGKRIHDRFARRLDARSGDVDLGYPIHAQAV